MHTICEGEAWLFKNFWNKIDNFKTEMRKTMILLYFPLPCRQHVLDSPVCYYLDATGGDDNNSGLAPDEAWKSLEKLRGVKLLPGNKVLLKRGEVFNGELEITGQGIPEDRIYIDAYGDGERKPCIVGYDTSFVCSPYL